MGARRNGWPVLESMLPGRVPLCLLLLAACLAATRASAQTVTTIAGTVSEFAGDGGPALAAAMKFPYGIAVAPDGTIYVADNGNFRIRKIDPAGIITTVAGDGTPEDVLNTNGGDGGPATAAQLAGVLSIALDPTGTTLYIADIDANRIRRVNLTTGIIGPFAGTGVFGYQGDGGPASAAQLAVPQGVAVDPAGHVYVADTFNCVIRKVDGGTGIITTFAGSGACTTAGDGGPAINASFRVPTRLTVDSHGHVFVIDANANVVRRIDAVTGIITTVAGGGSVIPGSGAATTMDLGPIGDGDPAVDAAGQLFVANPWQIFRVDLASGQLEAFAGTGVAGFAGDSGPPLAAQFDDIGGLAFTPAGALLVSDVKNSRIRSISAPGILVSDITFDNTALVAISCGSGVTAATGSVTITGNLAATSIDCGSVITAGGSVAVTNNTSAGSVDLSALVSSSGNVAVTNNTTAGSVDLSALTSTGGSVSVDGNTSATGVSLPSLTSTGGGVSVDGNTSATGIDLGALTTAGGNVNVDNNTSATGIDLASLTVVNGDLIVSDNGSCTTVTFGALTAVTGNLTLESCGIGTFTPGPAAAGGNATVATAGYTTVSGTTGNGATAISNATPDARVTVQLQASSFVTPVSFSLTRLEPATLLPEAGLAAGGGAATIDPVAAYQITSGVPTLNRDAMLTFDVFPAGLDVTTAAALLEAVTNGVATLVTKGDAPDANSQAFPSCPGSEEPAADGCVRVELLDAIGQPTTDPPAILRFSNVVGHFSVWGVALVTPAPTAAPQKLGYWKKTPSATQALLPQALGTYVVDTLDTANAILHNTNCSSTQPNNAVGCLAGHLLAAKLNLTNGVSACIQATVVAADALLATLRYGGPSGSYRLTAAQRHTALVLKTGLERYNNGLGCQ